MRRLYLLPLFLLPLLLTGCTTSEGIAQIDDCPEVITVEPDSFTAQRQSFVCDYRKTINGGETVSGFCVSRDTAAFTGKCQRAYTYEVPSEVQCGANAYASTDDQCPDGQTGSCPCNCKAGFVRNSNKECVPERDSFDF